MLDDRGIVFQLLTEAKNSAVPAGSTLVKVSTQFCNQCSLHIYQSLLNVCTNEWSRISGTITKVHITLYPVPVTQTSHNSRVYHIVEA
jgi:hypothetical protein